MIKEVQLLNKKHPYPSGKSAQFFLFRSTAIQGTNQIQQEQNQQLIELLRSEADNEKM